MPSPEQAVRRGHLTVTLPVLATIAAGFLLGQFLLTPPRGGVGIVLGALVAWPVWSYQIPRWRDWVVASGLAPGDVEPLAVRTGLLWPRGSFFERTEFRRKNGAKGW